MPKRARYLVRWSQEQQCYQLLDQEAPERDEPELEVAEGEHWQHWLGEHQAFAFYGRNGHLNLLKEKRSRGQSAGYWYAYQRVPGRMLKRYAGREARLDLGRLEELASLLQREMEVRSSREQSPAQKVKAGTKKVARLSDPLSEKASPAKVEQHGQGGIDAGAGDAFVHAASPGALEAVRAAVQFEPLLMSKLQGPRLQKSLLPRTHLLKVLDGTLERKLTIIAGPAGYGKTTLIGQWLADCSTRQNAPRIAYITLDEGDNEPIRFWRYVIAACQQILPGSGKEALKLLLTHRLLPLKPLETMFIALLNELSQLEQPGVLVLDDFHMINSPQVNAMLSFFVDYLPTAFHVILLIRGDPPLSLARLRARNELLEIHPPYLSFSLEETRAFFEQELPFSLSAKIVRQIFERMDGWPAGLRLLARELSLVDTEAIDQVLSSVAGSHWSLRDYFLTEVMHTLSPDYQEFVLQTSILPLLTAALCDAITGRLDSAYILNELRAGDLFLIPLDGQGEWTRYQSIFAEAMQQEARRRLGEKELRWLAIRASTWYEEHGLFPEAIETALNAATFTRAAHLIAQFVQQHLKENISAVPELYRLNRWCAQLPESELENNPQLCLHYAMTILFIQMEGPRFENGKELLNRLLQLAEQCWRDANNLPKLAEVFAFRALLARQEGRVLQAVTWARQSLAWLPPEERVWRNLSLTVVGLGELLEGSLENAQRYLVEALALSVQLGNLTYGRATRGMLAGVSFEQGELRHAAELNRQIQDEAREQEDYDDIGHTQLALARIAYQYNDLERAEQAANESLRFGEWLHVEEFESRATICLALVEQARQQPGAARQRLTSLLARLQVPTSPYSYQLLREVQACLAYMQLLSGDQPAVEGWFADIERREERLPLLQQHREQLLYARLLLAQGKVIPALERLENLERSAFQTGHLLLRLEVLVVLALAYQRQGQPPRASELALQLLTSAYGEGYIRLFLDEGHEMANLLRSLLPRLREKRLQTYALDLLAAFPGQLDTAEASVATHLLLAPLSAQERRVLHLLAAGNSNAEIARELVVSVNTVRTQLQSIYRKLNVNNRVEASLVARQLESGA